MQNLVNHPKLKTIKINDTVDFILAQQKPDGAISWYSCGKLDPWDHTEAAMALTVAGKYQQAQSAYHWLKDNQNSDGSWQANYFSENNPKLCETNFIAYIATGVWHYYLITQDNLFLSNMFPCVEAAINCVLRYQSEHGEIAWAFNNNKVAEPDALLTACSSILRSIECAINSAKILNKNFDHWSKAWHKLSHVICHQPERFDRTWESKARFAMDWYYPILGGAIAGEAAQKRLTARWQEFVVEDLGCRCVNDEPWVTMAESSELVISLVAAGDLEKAEKLFQTLPRWRDTDGGYWTGYVFRDNAIWPEEKTSWTAGAVILAADALYKITPAAELFTKAGDIY